jgi:hypothetical protein
MIPHSLGDGLEKMPAITRIERRRRSAQRVEIFSRQLQHRHLRPTFARSEFFSV